jgi:hypothetical protein
MNDKSKYFWDKQLHLDNMKRNFKIFKNYMWKSKQSIFGVQNPKLPNKMVWYVDIPPTAPL